MSDLRNTILRPDMKERGRDDRRNLRALAQENHDLKKQARQDRKRIKELEAELLELGCGVDKAHEVELARRDNRIEELEEYFQARSHMCSGRDCVGIFGDLTGSMYRCDDCQKAINLFPSQEPEG